MFSYVSKVCSRKQVQQTLSLILNSELIHPMIRNSEVVISEQLDRDMYYEAS